MLRFTLFCLDSCHPFNASCSGSTLGPLASDPPGELDVLGHDGHPLGVDGAQIGVLEQADEVRLGCFLEEEFQICWIKTMWRTPEGPLIRQPSAC